MITDRQEAVKNRKATVGTFLDTEEAFDSTSFNIIIKAAKWYGLGDVICQCTDSMLVNREITDMLAGEILEGSMAKGCLQGFYHPCCGAWL